MTAQNIIQVLAASFPCIFFLLFSFVNTGANKKIALEIKDVKNALKQAEIDELYKFIFYPFVCFAATIFLRFEFIKMVIFTSIFILASIINFLLQNKSSKSPTYSKRITDIEHKKKKAEMCILYAFSGLFVSETSIIFLKQQTIQIINVLYTFATKFTFALSLLVIMIFSIIVMIETFDGICNRYILQKKLI